MTKTIYYSTLTGKMIAFHPDIHIAVRENGMIKHKRKWTYGTEGSQGYAVFKIQVNGMTKQIRIHRLVAESFIPNPYKKPCVDHINRVRLDNRKENLRWATPKENGENQSPKWSYLRDT